MRKIILYYLKKTDYSLLKLDLCYDVFHSLSLMDSVCGVFFQGEVEVRKINGHSSEEEKEEEVKEPWPDDHSSSR